jgi:hypothetical protein
MVTGPVEYIIVGFPGNDFTGEIAPALVQLVESGTIRVLDLIFVAKDGDGNVLSFEYDALDELAAFADLDGECGGLISEEDIAYAGAGLEPNSAAALHNREDVWANDFVTAVRGAGGVLLEGGRIPHELVEAAFAGLPAAI